jgi:hypothetical protein
MTDIAVQREVARIDSPPIGRGLSESRRDRQLIPCSNWASTWSKVFLGRRSYSTRVERAGPNLPLRNVEGAGREKKRRLKAAKHNISLGPND